MSLARGLAEAVRILASDALARSETGRDPAGLPSRERYTETMGLEQALHAMGYRPLDPARRKWAKPVGYSVYTFDTDARVWAQRFRAADDGRVCTHDTVPWAEEDATLEDFLAFAETWHSHRIVGEGHGRHVWHFTTEPQVDL